MTKSLMLSHLSRLLVVLFAIASLCGIMHCTKGESTLVSFFAYPPGTDVAAKNWTYLTTVTIFLSSNRAEISVKDSNSALHLKDNVVLGSSSKDVISEWKTFDSLSLMFYDPNGEKPTKVATGSGSDSTYQNVLTMETYAYDSSQQQFVRK